jgi:hypothetical protein
MSIRSALLVAAAACAAVLPGAPAGRAEPSKDAPDAPAAKFKGSADLLNTVQIASTFSKDGQAATALFRNLEASVGGVKGGPLVDSRVVTLALPIEAKGKAVQVRQILRGNVDARTQSRAVLMVQSGGKTTLVDLTKSKKGDKGGDIIETIEATIPGGAAYQVTFVLMVERDADAAETGARLTVDAFDVEIVPPKKEP